MKLMTTIKYDHRATIIHLDEDADTENPWVEGDNIYCRTRPLDRMGFVLMETDQYFEEDRHRFYNIRNRDGVVLYPYPDEDEGRVLQIFDVSVRLDAFGKVVHYSYILAGTDQ